MLLIAGLTPNSSTVVGAQYADPDKSYVYCIDGRGRLFTDYMGMTDAITDIGVSTREVTVTRVMPKGPPKISKQVRVAVVDPGVNTHVCTVLGRPIAVVESGCIDNAHHTITGSLC